MKLKGQKLRNVLNRQSLGTPPLLLTPVPPFKADPSHSAQVETFLSRHIKYLSTAVIKRHDQGNLQKGRVHLDLEFQRDKRS